MIVGTPPEIKDQEHRVGLTPFGAEALVQAGQTVLVETGAGSGSGFSDDEYRAAGARVLPTAARVWAADLVVKVKDRCRSSSARSARTRSSSPTSTSRLIRSMRGP